MDHVALFLPGGATQRGAIAWSGGTILALGDPRSVREVAGARARRIQLPGALVLPGLCDCHTHMLASSVELSMARLRTARTIALYAPAALHPRMSVLRRAAAAS